MNPIIEDLELLIGKRIRGDITPIVYELVKESPYIYEFAEILNKVLTRERKSNVYKHDENQNTIEDTNTRYSVEEWLSNNGKSVTIPRIRRQDS